MQAFADDQNRVEIFSTCPESRLTDPEYARQVIEVSRWSEESGCRGILVYTDNGLLDPWLVSQIILENTKTLAPLVAVQPAYMHPYTVAKMITTFAQLYRRRIYLNMVAGGFKNDLVALGDPTSHDDRYGRMTEYTCIIRKLLESPTPVTFAGKFYSVSGLKMTPPLPPELFPGILSSGSSAAGMAAARTIGAVAVKYPKAPGEPQEIPEDIEVGVRVGIIARTSAEEAWQVALTRFPDDRKGQLKHELAMKVSDSVWHTQLSVPQESVATPDNPYWLGPFQNYATFCPYLVGSYEQVAGILSQYVELGYRTFILDIPAARDELNHTGTVFRMALELLHE